MRHPKNLASQWDEHFVEEIEFGNRYGLIGSLRRIPKVIYSREAQLKLQRLLTTVSPEVAHAHNVYHHISPSIFPILHQHNVPTFLTLHDLKLACPAHSMLTHDGLCERCKGGHYYNVIRHRCIKNSVSLSSLVFLETVAHRLLGIYERGVTQFISPSRFLRDKLVEWGWDPRKIAHIPNFVSIPDTPRFGDTGAILYLGRLSQEKGLRTLIRAATKARANILLAGDGPEANSLRSLAGELAAPVRFLGHVAQSDLPAVMEQVSSVILPSECYENAPLSIMEGSAAGIPVIGSRIGGIPELIHEGVTGATFAAGSTEELAARLAEFSQMPLSKLRSIGEAGREWMASEFSERAFVDRTLALYSHHGVTCA
jgi:glycosyltransferase involved in cell wall biosynthesis